MHLQEHAARTDEDDGRDAGERHGNVPDGRRVPDDEVREEAGDEAGIDPDAWPLRKLQPPSAVRP